MSGTTANAPPASPGKILAMLAAAIALLLFVLILVALANSQPHEISETYGRRRGNGAADSVNGTAVLAAMFESSGRKVSTITELGRRAEKFDTIVWIPDSLAAPESNVEQYFEKWLRDKPNRTLIYIGRDYDAAPDYWQEIEQNVEPRHKPEYERRWAKAQAKADSHSALMPERETSQWFVVRGDQPTRRIDSLDGPWASGIEVKETKIDLAGRLDLPTESIDYPYSSSRTGSSRRPVPTYSGPKIDLNWQNGDEYVDSSDIEVKVLLQSENDILVHSFNRTYWANSRVIVLANGAFTLNMPLVNKEHRKLAGKLIATCAAKGDVAFLESDSTGPRVRKSDSSEGGNHALQLFTIWPISFIFVHFAALGIAYCIAVFPIFGRPHRLPKEQRSDFGQHVSALGELLKKTRDVTYAENRVRQYQQQARRSSGKSHSRGATVDPPLPVRENKQISPSPLISVPPTDPTKPAS